MPLTVERKRLAEALVDTGCIKYGRFILTSGAISDIYVDLRDLRSMPEVKKMAVDEYVRMLREITDPVQHVVDMPDSISPVVASIADRMALSQLTVRKAETGHGTQKMVLGRYNPGEAAVMVDDVITKGKSFLAAYPWLTDQEAHLVVRHAVVLVDRQQGGRQRLQKLRIALHSALNLSDLRTK